MRSKDKKFTGMLLPPVLKRRLETVAEKCGISLSDLCRGLLDAGVSRLDAATETGEVKEAMENRAENFEQWLVSMLKIYASEPKAAEYEV